MYVEEGPSQAFHRNAGAAHRSPDLLRTGEPGGLRETAFIDPPQLTPLNEQDCIYSSLSYGLDICAVGTNRVIGQAHIGRYITGHDARRILILT